MYSAPIKAWTSPGFEQILSINLHDSDDIQYMLQTFGAYEGQYIVEFLHVPLHIKDK